MPTPTKVDITASAGCAPDISWLNISRDGDANGYPKYFYGAAQARVVLYSPTYTKYIIQDEASHTWVKSDGNNTDPLGTYLADTGTGSAGTATVSESHSAPVVTFSIPSVAQRTVTVTPTATTSDGTTLTDLTLHWGDGTTTAGCASGEPVSHTYAPAGGTFGVYAVATDSLGTTGQSETAQVVIDPNASPICSFVVSIGTDNRTITVNANASSDPDGTIAAWSFLPGNGAGWQAGTVGYQGSYTYPTHGVYQLKVEVTDSEGATAQQQVEINAENQPPVAGLNVVNLIDRLYTAEDSSVDADGTVVSRLLDWGDGTDPVTVPANGMVSHRYTDAGVYTLTYTVTDDDGATNALERIISMASITKVAAPSGPLAIPGTDVITITGTGLPTTGAVKIGGVEATVETSPARSATSIAVKAGAATPLGAQDVVVYSDDPGTAVAASRASAIMLYDPTDTRDGSQVPYQEIDMIYIDGKCVGFAGDGMKLTPSIEKKSYIPPNSYMPAAQKSFLTNMEISLKIDQVDGAVLAMILGGTYDADTKVLAIPGDQELGQHSIVAKDTNNTLTLVRAAVISGGGEWNLGAKDYTGIDTTWTAIKLANAPLLEAYFA